MMSGLIVLLLCSLLFEVAAKVTDSHFFAIHTEKGVITSKIPHHVGKREKNDKDVAGFSDLEKKAILKVHNALRAREGSSNMKRMEPWSNDLETLAQNYDEKCVFDHSTKEYRKDVGGFTYIGENLYAGTGC